MGESSPKYLVCPTLMYFLPLRQWRIVGQRLATRQSFTIIDSDMWCARGEEPCFPLLAWYGILEIEVKTNHTCNIHFQSCHSYSPASMAIFTWPLRGKPWARIHVGVIHLAFFFLPHQFTPVQLLCVNPFPSLAYPPPSVKYLTITFCLFVLALTSPV